MRGRAERCFGHADDRHTELVMRMRAQARAAGGVEIYRYGIASGTVAVISSTTTENAASAASTTAARAPPQGR